MTVIAGIFEAWLVVQVAIEARYQISNKKGKDIKTE